MTPENFVYWLNGYLELRDAGTDPRSSLDPSQVKVIKEHLKLVMTKVTPESTQVRPVLPEPTKKTLYELVEEISKKSNNDGLNTNHPAPSPPYTITCSASEIDKAIKNSTVYC